MSTGFHSVFTVNVDEVNTNAPADIFISFCLTGIQIPDSPQIQTSLRTLMEGLQIQLKERYSKHNRLLRLKILVGKTVGLFSC